MPTHYPLCVLAGDDGRCRSNGSSWYFWLSQYVGPQVLMTENNGNSSPIFLKGVKLKKIEIKLILINISYLGFHTILVSIRGHWRFPGNHDVFFFLKRPNKILPTSNIGLTCRSMCISWTGVGNCAYRCKQGGDHSMSRKVS